MSKDEPLDFILAGFPKCATTSLAHILSQHPQISFSHPKEPSLFINKEDINPKHKFTYATAFSEVTPNTLRAEGTQRYTTRDRYPYVAENIAAHSPNVKLIFMVREPLERALSHFKMIDRDINVKISINQIFEHKWLVDSVVNTSKYYYQLEPYLSLFPREYIHLCFYEDFTHHKNLFFEELAQFLELSPFIIEEEVKLNTAETRPRTSTLYNGLNKIYLYNLVKKCLPLQIRDKYRFIVRKRFNPEKNWQMSEEFKDLFYSEIKSDLKSFLELTDKPSSFYACNQPQ